MVNLTQIQQGLTNIGSKVESKEVKAVINTLPNNQRKAAMNALNVAKKAAAGLKAAKLPLTPTNMTKMAALIKTNNKPNN